MIKKLCYASLLIVSVFLATDLFLTHSLATSGSYLGNLNQGLIEKQQVVDQLKRQVMEARSLTMIRKKAENLGFTGGLHSQRLNPPALADKQ